MPTPTGATQPPPPDPKSATPAVRAAVPVWAEPVTPALSSTEVAGAEPLTLWGTSLLSAVAAALDAKRRARGSRDAVVGSPSD